MNALSRVVLAGVGRRRAQTAVLTLTVLMAVTASILAAGLLVGFQTPFDRAFAEQRGAHLTAQFDATSVTTAELGATAGLPGVTAAAGPYPTTTVRPRLGVNAMNGVNGPNGVNVPNSVNGPNGSNTANLPAGLELPLLTVVGRADAGGPVDDVALVDGAWADGPGEIVLDSDGDLPPVLGRRLEIPDLPGSPTLTVVGLADSAGRSASGWVTPAQLAALTPAGTASGFQMLYRLGAADTDAQIRAGLAAIEAAVPPGALTGSRSYLDLRRSENAETAAYVPFVAAFGVLGLAMSTLIIGIVVSGAVGAATWRIGVLKSLGFTPTQVVRAFVGQALIPAAAGVGLGVLLGNLLAVPVLDEQADAFGGGTPSIPPWVDVTVAAAAFAMVACAAVAPALRAGRMRAVEAITVGRAPRARRGHLAQRLAARLPLPRALSLGLANPFTRPARSTVMAAAVGLGAVGITFAIGLGTTLATIQTENNRDSSAPVVVDAVRLPDPYGRPAMSGPDPAMSDPDPAAVAATIAAQSGTARSYGVAETELSVIGIAGTTNVTAYQGDSSWAARPMISGAWFGGPGEAVVDTQFLRAADVQVGDTVTLTDHGRTAPVRIVGELFDLESTVNLLTDMSSLAGLEPDLTPSRFDVDLKPGTDLRGYVSALDEALRPVGGQAWANIGENSTVIATMVALISTLTLMIVAVAILGVLNTVVLETRDRIHDLGVFKALGMTPRQTITMVVTSVAGIGAVAGLVGVPVGIALHHYVVPLMGDAVGTGMPSAYLAVYHLPELVPLALGGLVIAAVGALLPAGWAAGTRTATALRTE
jgi:putative ABC transport system permease protein